MHSSVRFSAIARRASRSSIHYSFVRPFHLAVVLRTIRTVRRYSAMRQKPAERHVAQNSSVFVRGQIPDLGLAESSYEPPWADSLPGFLRPRNDTLMAHNFHTKFTGIESPFTAMGSIRLASGSVGRSSLSGHYSPVWHQLDQQRVDSEPSGMRGSSPHAREEPRTTQLNCNTKRTGTERRSTSHQQPSGHSSVV